MKFGRYYEEFEPGVVIEHQPGKTVTESDNNLFCLLTLNRHPVHSDAEYAKSVYHGKILVVGTYVFSLVVGMSVRDISGLATANLEYSQVKHLQPVFIGDTIHARSTIKYKRLSSSSPGMGVVTVYTQGMRGSEPVVDLTRVIFVPCKEEPS